MTALRMNFKHITEKIKYSVMKVKEAINIKMRAFLASYIAMMAAFCPAIGTYCAPTTASLINSMIDVISQVAQYTGILIAVGGVFMLVLAYKDDNADQQSRAIRLIVIGGVLIGLKAILGQFGLTAS